MGRDNILSDKIDYFTDELRDNDQLLLNKVREELNLQIIKITDMIEKPNLGNSGIIMEADEDNESEAEIEGEKSPVQPAQRSPQSQSPLRKLFSLRDSGPFGSQRVNSFNSDNEEQLRKKIKKIKSRITNLEKSIQFLLPKDFTRNFSKSIFELDLTVPNERDSFVHEFHLKYAVLLNESNQLKQMFKMLKPNDPPADSIKPDRIPNFQQYIPYMNRI